MSIIFDEIVTEVNAPSTETLGNENPLPRENDLDSAQLHKDLIGALERFEKRQIRLFAD